MPPYLLSRDSPRAQHGRRRPPRGQLARSGSLIGALKNIVSVPLAWFTSYDDQENLSGKRGRPTNAILEDEGTYHEDQPSAKRKRVDSPDPPAPLPQLAPRSTQGYLDVPDNLLSKPVGGRHRSGAQPGHGRSSSMVAPLSIPAVQGAHPARRTASPAGILGPGQLITTQRTQSMDPPQYRVLSLSRDVSMEDGQPASATRDVTMSPSRRDPFQLRARSSLTPQPTGQMFGPNVHHKERDASEPPPLAALMSKPQFVKPPPQTAQGQAGQDITTLGSLAEAKGRISRSPMRQHSGLFLGARPGTIAESDSSPYTKPINAAEKALIDLDVYKTPLLPSRLHGAEALPEMFKPKKSHAPVLMRSDTDRARKPRLGTAEKKGKKKEKVEEVAPKPYAGRGGMKKMLARRKREEQAELEKERENAIEEDQDEVAQLVAEKGTFEAPKETPRLSSPPAVLAPSSRPVGGREQSSLRVGRTRTSRNHIARPISKAKNRFSAVFDEDEGEEANEESREEEPKKLPTLFESPKGFTFAQDAEMLTTIQKAPVLHDSSNAKEPPISALPFSFAKPSAAPTAPGSSLAQPFSFAQPPKTPPLAPRFAKATTEGLAPKASEPVPATPAETVPSVPSVPSISLIPPSPAPAKPAADAATTTSSTAPTPIPNFFANSSVFSKPGVAIAPPVPSPALVTEEAKPPAPPSLFGGLPSFAPSATPKETPATTTEAPKPVTAPAFSFGASASTPAPAPAASSPALSSGFSFASVGQAKDAAATQPTPSLFSTPAPAKEATPEAKAPAPASSPFSFGAPASKVAETSAAPASLPFSFGGPVAKSSTTAAPATAPSPAPFSFGQPKPEAAKAPEAKPLFGASEPAKSSLFGPPPASSPSPFGASQTSVVTEASKPAFSFGTPSPSTPAATVEAPKPLFPSTSTGSTGGFTFASTAPSAASPATPAKTPFSFGVGPATPPVTTPIDTKPAFTFGAPTTPAVSAPTTLFGGPSTGSNGADVSKPFTFGSSAPTRPITPPQKEQEMRMEESPTRGGGMEINGESKSSTGFNFGTSNASISSRFGQPSQPSTGPFAFGNKTETKPEVKPVSTFGGFGQSASSSPFAFGSKPAESVQSPISPAPFGSSAPFGQAASTLTATTSPFNFGAPSGGATGGFGQPSTGIGSQPASPSTFGQPSSSPFAFGVTPTSATAPSNAFAFGSQPASPANGNPGLPQPPGSSGGPAFTFGAPSSGNQSPSSPFGAAPSLPASGGGVGFTIGSAAPQQGAPGVRQIRKLPNRTRGGRPR